jgi:hypothetical protein
VQEGGLDEDQGLAADTSQLALPGFGSDLAFHFCGFGDAGQRWLVQLKPKSIMRHSRGGTTSIRSTELVPYGRR